MKIKTFRAKTMQQALNLVRRELGPEATVLHTRELNTGLISRYLKGKEYEIAASTEVQVPARLPQRQRTKHHRHRLLHQLLKPIIDLSTAMIFNGKTKGWKSCTPLPRDSTTVRRRNLKPRCQTRSFKLIPT